ncbi:DUF2589 domain-containing protein [Blastococcus litoris]|uniref:DUF2589 domain-containing protein n=1 Tax=Blastococcus litoris TaxID=2171622 RepID=UPI000E30A3B8|nr:DUF2589 domain-containing protein [Blastococcus litoris]
MAEPVSGTARLVEDYLGSTLGSLVKAQGLLSSQLAEFVERVGFEPAEDDDAPLRARTFSFAFERTEVDGEEFVTRRVTASLPLLSIVSLPSLAIDAADVQMDLRIVATEAPPDPPEPEPRPPGRPPGGPLVPPVRPPLRMWAIPVRPAPLPLPGRPAAPDPATVGSIRVSVTLRRLDLPLGLERVERLLNEGYREEIDEA